MACPKRSATTFGSLLATLLSGSVTLPSNSATPISKTANPTAFGGLKYMTRRGAVAFRKTLCVTKPCAHDHAQGPLRESVHLPRLDAFEPFCHDAGAGLAGGQSHESASARCWYLKKITIEHTKELR